MKKLFTFMVAVFLKATRWALSPEKNELSGSNPQQ